VSGDCLSHPLSGHACNGSSTTLMADPTRPRAGERIDGRHNIQESRFVQPNKKRFTVLRIIGSGDLWVTEFVLTYDGIPSCAVSMMEFRKGLVAHETQYFANRFDPAPSRAHLVEQVGEITSF
jgi:hypothetical protein